MKKELNDIEAKLGADSKADIDKLEADVDAVHKAAQANDVEKTAKAIEDAAVNLKASLKLAKKYPILYKAAQTLVAVLEGLAKKVRKDKKTDMINDGMRLLAWLLDFTLPLDPWRHSIADASLFDAKNIQAIYNSGSRSKLWTFLSSLNRPVGVQIEGHQQHIAKNCKNVLKILIRSN